MATVVEREAFGPGVAPDRGCQYAPRCIECPLPACIEDVGIKPYKAPSIRRRKHARAYYRQKLMRGKTDLRKQCKQVNRLTPAAQRRWSRDRIIFDLIGKGASQMEIARLLGVSQGTVSNALRK